MPLNILRHKSWHPGNADALARVARDEAAAAAAAAAEAARASAAEGEARLEALRTRAGLPPAARAPVALPAAARAAPATAAAAAPPPPDTRLGYGSAELAGAAKPFYQRLDGGPVLRHSFIPARGGAEDASRALARDRARLEAADPLRLVTARLAAAAAVAPAAPAPPRKRRWDDAAGAAAAAPEPASPPPDASRLLPGGKTFAQLREERLRREAGEVGKAAVLMGRR